MNIEKKIEEIRAEPEHVRIRYVIGAVVISMLFVIIIWIASIKQTFQDFDRRTEDIQPFEATELLEEFNQTQEEVKQSLEEVLENTAPASDEFSEESIRSTEREALSDKQE